MHSPGLSCPSFLPIGVGGFPPIPGPVRTSSPLTRGACVGHSQPTHILYHITPPLSTVNFASKPTEMWSIFIGLHALWVVGVDGGLWCPGGVVLWDSVGYFLGWVKHQSIPPICNQSRTSPLYSLLSLTLPVLPASLHIMLCYM